MRYLPERQVLSYAASRPRGLDLTMSLIDVVADAATAAMDGLTRGARSSSTKWQRGGRATRCRPTTPTVFAPRSRRLDSGSRISSCADRAT